jgi:amino acid transporter/signal transduction histidine kinase
LSHESVDSAGRASSGDAGHLSGVERLKENALRLRDVVFQNVANMAPAATIAYNLPLQASVFAAGAALALANGLALLAVLLISSAIIQFARKLPSAGGFYTYVSRGLGEKAGAFTGFIFFIYAGVLPAEVTLIWSGITHDLIRHYAHLNVSWVVWEILILSLVAYLAFTGVQRSTRVAMVAGMVEMGVFVALSVALLLHPASPVNFKPFLPSSSPAGWAGILGFGLVYGILGFTGFEGAAPLAEETQNPRRNIPLSVILSALILGFVYVLAAFAVVPGWGAGHLQGFSSSGSPFTELASRLWGPAWIFIYLAMTNSSLACCLASTNASARVLYSMGRVGLLPLFGHVDSVHRTPSYAILFQSVVSILLALVSGLLWGTVMGFAVLAITLTFGAVVIYAMGNIALPVFYFKEHRSEFSKVKHALIPLAALPLLGAVLYRSVSPVPAYPLNLPAYVTAVWVALAVMLVAYLARTRPAALQKSGLTVLQSPPWFEQPPPSLPSPRASSSHGAELGEEHAHEPAIFANQGVALELNDAAWVADVQPIGGVELALSLQLRPRASISYLLGDISPALAKAIPTAVRERRSLDTVAVCRSAQGRHLALNCQLKIGEDGHSHQLVLRTENVPVAPQLADLAIVLEQHQTLLAEVLSRLNQDSDLKESLQAVLSMVLVGLDMQAGAFYMTKGERAELVAVFGPTQRRAFPYPDIDLADPLFAALLRDPHLASLPPRLVLPESLEPIVVRNYGLLLIVPAVAGRSVTGLLVLSRRLERPLSLSETAFLSSLSDILGLSVRTKQLEAESQHSDAVLQTAYAVSRAISGSLDLQETFRQIAANAAKVVPGSSCLLLKVDAQTEDLVASSSSDEESSGLIGLRVRVDEESRPDLAVAGASLAVREVKWGARTDHWLTKIFDPSSAVLIPLTAKARLIGALLVYSTGRRRRYTSIELAQLEDVGEQAATAILNAELYQNLSESQAHVQSLLARVTRVREQERQALGRVVHDGIVQSIVGASYRFDAFRRHVPDAAVVEFEEALGVLRQSMRDARSVIWELRPPVLDGLGLAGALKALADRAGMEGQATVGCSVCGSDGLAPGVAVGLYKIAREALMNAVRHAEADRISLELSEDAEAVRLRVKDDGVGISSDAAKRDHYGIVMMEEQAASVGAELTVRSNRGSGTVVEVVAPKAEAAEGEGSWLQRES